MVNYHGRKEVSNILTSEEYEELKGQNFLKLSVSKTEYFDLFLLGVGLYAPLEGFMDEDDYYSTLEQFTLSSGFLWSIPIVLRVSEEEARLYDGREKVLLTAANGELLGLLESPRAFKLNKILEVEKVFKTSSPEHPGVQKILGEDEWAVAGKIKIYPPAFREIDLNLSLFPQKTREIFKSRNYKTVVGFQTRNPIHRAHEYLQKIALEIFDGLFVNPLVGETKGDDIPADVRLKCYEALLNNYYPKDRFVFATLPAPMRYAGPREAVHHAIIRQNYGCTHFIVGRDHAGVGNFYGPFEAQEIFDTFPENALEIKIVKFDNAFYCSKCGQMATKKTCPHGPEHHLSLSGTKVREMLREGKPLPEEFTRPEVAEVLRRYYQSL
ncbi:sulfate adenylyltransferase [Carboxydothermus hydrogenoformans]|uniref:Sulfate adenylyltransferase n=1 Tax=Carboxydothermus hydrogenoformans (strain ATCC BAA-161 / DSM 6008 / Z-2901) TaxID=246194 RepID=SAT_CARHZ|nr:sulfate adenylyltransferase [Carboxydothermus hydrogenoformans]Q3A8R0.1 RecName: Full=Sulfate adenylyltransferase; AltName: Full=ATP-sulfurylase; AltName: Full=Sulfate adenylate transferase; Short=SAT [Carboxydothermus hydrogenoformans Z-2901]ABB15092.1 sulfate adenylyltransferase [Carboxydothermus hydrogenoformans Z-2901]